MNKKYTLIIPPFGMNNKAEALKALKIVEYVLNKHEINGEYEKEFSEKGVELELNGSYFEDGFIKGMVGEHIIEPVWLQ